MRQAFIDITFGDKKQRLTVMQGIDENTDITDKFDPKFAQALQEKGYIKDATHITWQDVSKQTDVRVAESQLTSVQGIEYFTSLKTFFCNKNQLTSLDMSKNTKLEQLYCYENQLVSLDVSGCTALTRLDCYSNQLAELDVSENKALELFYCWDNRLTALDVSSCAALSDVRCHNNPGDGEVFPLTAWFDENNMPRGLSKSWRYDDKYITLYLQKSGPEEFYLTLNPRKVEVAAAGGTIGVAVSTNVEYDVIIPAEATNWISRVNGGKDEIRFNIAENDSYDSREAKVVVKARDKELSDTLHIVQETEHVLLLSEKYFTVPMEGGDISVEVKSNVEYEVIISQEYQNWIQQIPSTRGLVSSTVGFRISKYDGVGAADRIGKIIVRDKNNGLAVIIYITQRGGVYVGDVKLATKQDLINFSKYTKIIGNVSVTGQELKTLQELNNNLVEIDGSLSLNCSSLTTLSGLDNLSSVGGILSIVDCDALTSLSGLDNLSSVGEVLNIYGCAALTSLSGLENLSSVYYNLSIENCAALTSLIGLDNLSSVGGLSIENCAALTSLIGLKNLSSVHELNIYNCAALTSLIGLENLSEIGSGVYINDCRRLSDYCALKNVLQLQTSIYRASGNKYNPTREQILNGECSK